MKNLIAEMRAVAQGEVKPPADAALVSVETAKLASLWKEGLKSGPGQFDTMDAIKREARGRLDSTAPGNPDRDVR